MNRPLCFSKKKKLIERGSLAENLYFAVQGQAPGEARCSACACQTLSTRPIDLCNLSRKRSFCHEMERNNNHCQLLSLKEEWTLGRYDHALRASLSNIIDPSMQQGVGSISRMQDFKKLPFSHRSTLWLLISGGMSSQAASVL